jgi:hypothetical protein
MPENTVLLGGGLIHFCDLGDGEQERRVLFRLQAVQSVRNNQEIPGLSLPRIPAGTQEDTTAEDKDRGLPRILVLTQLRTCLHGDDGLAEDLLMSAVHGVRSPPGAGCNSSLELLPGEGVDRYLLHEATVPTGPELR